MNIRFEKNYDLSDCLRKSFFSTRQLGEAGLAGLKLKTLGEDFLTQISAMGVQFWLIKLVYPILVYQLNFSFPFTLVSGDKNKVD